LTAALAERLLFCGLAGIFSSSRYITGTLYIAINGPFVILFAFIELRGRKGLSRFDSGKHAADGLQKIVDFE
jgi:hypothetical protein